MARCLIRLLERQASIAMTLQLSIPKVANDRVVSVPLTMLLEAVSQLPKPQKPRDIAIRRMLNHFLNRARGRGLMPSEIQRCLPLLEREGEVKEVHHSNGEALRFDWREW